MKRYIYYEKDELSDRGYNMAVVVYQLRRGDFPLYVGANYKLSHASTYGYKGEACQVISREHGHKTDNYKMISKNIEVKGV